jgi:Fe-S cluster assembly iron-binding protein IscA
MIEVTKKAQEQMATFFEKNKDEARSIRVYLQEGG